MPSFARHRASLGLRGGSATPLSYELDTGVRFAHTIELCTK